MAVPPTHWNPAIHDEHGRYVGRPDGWWEDVALAWEIDSLEYHFYRSGYDNTMKRNNRYAAAGITLVQTSPSRLKTAPDEVLAELEAAYRRALARPRPVTSLAA